MRPEILFPLFSSVSTLKGVGPRVAPLLEKLAGPIVRDVLFTAPAGLIRRSVTTVGQAIEGQVQTFIVTIDAHFPSQRLSQPWKIRAWDGTGFLTLIWFKGHGAHLERQHPKGAQRAVSGKVERPDGYASELQIAHPDYIVDAERAGEIPEIETVYPATAGLPSRTFRKFALEALERAPELPEWQDPAWQEREKLARLARGPGRLHAPASEADLSPLARPRRRLAYDELLAHQLALAQRKASRRASPAHDPAGPLWRRGREGPALQADRRPDPIAVRDPRRSGLGRADEPAAAGRCRLGQDRGGHAGHGRRRRRRLAVALMAPTEILARQHFETIAAPLRRWACRWSC
jgi:ATP-dependent DNA helicase RecG